MTDRLQLVNRITGTTEARRNAVAIVGFTDHRSQAPFGNPDWEFWGLNELYRFMPVDKFTRWFEMHPRADFERAEGGDLPHLESLKKCPLPVYMTEVHADIPTSVAFPRERVSAEVSTYMTSSIAWMLGLAIVEGFKRIGLYGVDMAQDTEYAEQRPCVEYLIGLARGRGIIVDVPKTSDILKSVAQYGYESQGNEFIAKLVERMGWLQKEHTTWQQRLAELEKQMVARTADLREQYDTQKVQMTSNLRQIEGAIDDCRYWKRSWGVQPTSMPGLAFTPDRGGMVPLNQPMPVEPMAALAAVQPAGGDGPSGA